MISSRFTQGSRIGGIGGLVESSANLISSQITLDSWIGGLVESYEESYLISSRFTLDSRIGGIGGLVESSADLWRWSPITMDPLWLFNMFGIPAVSRIPDSRIPDSRIPVDSRIPDSCWSRDLTFLTNLLSFVLSTRGVPSHRNEGLSVVVSSPEKNHNKYVSLLNCSPHGFHEFPILNFHEILSQSYHDGKITFNCY